ncbi:MAG TPA: hypothetical protein VNZ03_01430 [Terriglobales bacterium]|jgi:hypothetical protein|nr:hypothetical protein [Terriglobales bacterium]
MQRLQRLSVIAVLSGACGILLAILPDHWIETTFGVEPDGGGGLLELFLIFVPAVLCVALVIFCLCLFTSYAASRQPGHPLTARRR